MPSLQGLQCLQKDLDIGTFKKPSIIEEQVQCNSDEAIPLHYEPLKKSNLAPKACHNCSLKTCSGCGNENKDTTDSQDRSPSTCVASSDKSACDLTVTSVAKETSMKDEGQGQSWHTLSKGLLFRKASYTYAALAKMALANTKLDETLKCLKLAFYCFSKLCCCFHFQASIYVVV